MSDISPMLVFTLWQPVYVLLDNKEQAFPSKSKEVRGRFVVISEHIGHAMTFKILLDDSNEIVCRSIVRSALDPKLPNLRVEPNIKIEDNPSSIEKDVDPDSHTASILPPDKKEQVHTVPTHQQTCSQTRIRDQLLRNNPTINDPDTISPSLSDPEVTSKDPPPDDNSTVPETFVYMKCDGERSTKPPLWKPFKVPLLDKNGEQRYDDNGNPITIIARDLKILHSTVFLTNPDKHG